MQCHLKSLSSPLGQPRWVRKRLITHASRTNEIARFAIETNDTSKV